ncbi:MULTISPECIES: NAD-dependent epimerase/dehydratase family protein [unclassified Streptomyces]|uniref:NAD-dependent epimerase/dehydratase family protein n=1 Tax=unclassified Streptomyces TaxID=2593676 RepID=UPI0032542EB2
MAGTVKILVTGASGFLGGHLVDGALRQGHQVRALVRPGGDAVRLAALPGVEVVTGDLADGGSLARAAEGCEAVLHSAARVVDHGSRAQFETANVTGTERLLAAARSAGARRFVFVSSPSALMRVREGDRLGIDESTPFPERWFNHYCETKAIAEQYVRSVDGPEFTTCAIRPRGIWGPRDHAGFLPRMVDAMRAGRLPDLSGGKRVLVSLCHVDNAVDACLRAVSAPAERVGGKAYFVVDREETDLWPFLARVGALFDCPPPAPRIPLVLGRGLAAAVETGWRLRHRSTDGGTETTPPLSRYMMALLTRSATYDITAARHDLGYAAPRTRADGVRALREWVTEAGGVAAWTAGPAAWSAGPATSTGAAASARPAPDHTERGNRKS